MCKWRNVTVETGNPSNVTGAQQVLPFGKPNKNFRVSPFHLRPRTVLKACKIIKINRLNCSMYTQVISLRSMEVLVLRAK